MAILAQFFFPVFLWRYFRQVVNAIQKLVWLCIKIIKAVPNCQPKLNTKNIHKEMINLSFKAFLLHQTLLWITCLMTKFLRIPEPLVSLLTLGFIASILVTVRRIQDKRRKFWLLCGLKVSTSWALGGSIQDTRIRQAIPKKKSVSVWFFSEGRGGHVLIQSFQGTFYSVYVWTFFRKRGVA